MITYWVDEITQYLVVRGLSPKNARKAAYAILTTLEGAFLLACGLRSTEPFQAAGRMLAGYVAAMETGRTQVPPSPAG